MRAVVLHSHGGPEVLTVTEVPDPEPGPEEVVVDIVATALNRADLLQRMGRYPEPGPPRTHEIPGMELAGRVAAVGGRVSSWSVGDEVMGIVSGGSYAARIAVHERQLMRLPEGMTPAEAAAIPEVGITAHDAFVTQGGLRPGGWVLVHAGASGVGSMAVQVARELGARTVATASKGKVDAVRALGADVVVDYGAEDFVSAVSEATGGVGVDVVLDVVGGDYLMRNVAAVRVGGTIVQVGVMGGGRTEINLGALLPKRVTIVGTVLRPRPLEEKIRATRLFATEILPALDAGRIRPVIDRRFPLTSVAEAHEYLATNASVGKVLIDID